MHNGQITDGGIMYLPNLLNLNLAENCQITDKALKKLTKLRSLNLRQNNKITDGAITGRLYPKKEKVHRGINYEVASRNTVLGPIFDSDS